VKFIATCEGFSDSHLQITPRQLLTRETREMTRNKKR
jgi:hypothetical protein